MGISPSDLLPFIAGGVVFVVFGGILLLTHTRRGEKLLRRFVARSMEPLSPEERKELASTSLDGEEPSRPSHLP